jgi:hypothetical protein
MSGHSLNPFPLISSSSPHPLGPDGLILLDLVLVVKTQESIHNLLLILVGPSLLLHLQLLLNVVVLIYIACLRQDTLIDGVHVLGRL